MITITTKPRNSLIDNKSLLTATIDYKYLYLKKKVVHKKYAQKKTEIK